MQGQIIGAELVILMALGKGQKRAKQKDMETKLNG